jgi:hypothetical protein
MKNILALALSLTVLVVVSLKVNAQEPGTPLEMNNYLANITDSLYARGTEWGGILSESVQSKNYTTLDASTKKMLEFISRKKTDIKKLKDINNSKPLRDAMLEFLNFETRMVNDYFKPFGKFTDKTPQADFDAALKNLTAASGEETAFLDKVRTQQNKYAEDNGFTIDQGGQQN